MLVQARDGTGLAARAATVILVEPVADPPPTQSSPILSDGARDLLWVVNPDHDSITALAADLSSKTEIAVCDQPRSLALDGLGVLWVACTP